MVNWDVERGEIKAISGLVSSSDANVVLGVTGDLKGSIVFGFPEDLTFAMVKSMSGMDVKKLDGFVASALGEVANIISGRAMTELVQHGHICDIVPPQIFVGEYKSMSLIKEKTVSIPMETEIGEFYINVFLKETKEK